jgi:hypothetical protein
MGRVVRRTEANECRRCAAFCDRVIAPSTCVAAECPNLYVYDDPIGRRRYMGCVQQVFASEIDVEVFREAERTRAGFGTVRLAREPLGRCGFSVEQAFVSRRERGLRLRQQALLRLARRGPGRDPRLRPAGSLVKDLIQAFSTGRNRA